MTQVFAGLLIVALATGFYLWLRRVQSGTSLTTPQIAGALTDDEIDESEESPMISFVLFQRTGKYLEAMMLAKVVESAWGGTYSTDGDLNATEEGSDGMVVGESPLFVIQSKHGVYLVHNHAQPYFDEMEELLPKIPDLRLRKAVADHSGWLSVDLIGNPDKQDEEPDPAEFYPRITSIIAELADEDTLAIFQPETSEVNVWDEEMAEKMLSADFFETFSESNNVPVVQISDDDPALMASVEKAKETWPEFVAAFNEKADGCSNYGVKVKLTVEGETEFIWLDVIGLEPRFVHGTLGNDPVALGDLKLGSQVEVPLEDVQDWCYLRDGEPVGLYSLAAIQSAQERLANDE